MPLRARSVLILLVVGLLALQIPAQAVEKKLLPPSTESSIEFGHTVAIDGNIAVVGAPDANVGSLSDAGAVFLFKRNASGAWSRVGKLTASDAEEYDSLGTSVDIDGNVIVAGAPSANGSGPAGQEDSWEGTAYTFSADGSGDRTQTAKLYASDGQDGDRFGSSVAIDGTRIVVGAPAEDNDAQNWGNDGAAYTFARTGADPRDEIARLVPSDEDSQDQFGYAVDIADSNVVVGAPDADGGGFTKGQAYVFPRNESGNSVTELARLQVADAEGDEVGHSVAIDGNVIVVGAPETDLGPSGNTTDAGAAYTFSATGNGLINETAKLTASDFEASDDLGFDVAVSGPSILAGAPDADDAEDLSTGAAYVFSTTGDANRNQTSKIVPTDPALEAYDYFGESVGVSGPTKIAGARRGDVTVDNVGTTDTGVAYVFQPKFTEVDSNISLTYSNAADAFKGRVTSNLDACEPNRSVTVFKKRSGPDLKIGSRKTNDEGRYTIPAARKAGTFYAKTPAKSLANGKTCSAATDNIVLS